MNIDIFEKLTVTHWLIILVVIGSAYGIEASINNTSKNDCKNMCLLDSNGPNYKYSPMSILPEPSFRTSASHSYKKESSCSCYNKIETKSLKKSRDAINEEFLKNL
jgi:hypothetical protein